MEYNIILKFFWIETDANYLADTLSRNKLVKFHEHIMEDDIKINDGPSVLPIYTPSYNIFGLFA